MRLGPSPWGQSSHRGPAVTPQPQRVEPPPGAITPGTLIQASPKRNLSSPHCPRITARAGPPRPSTHSPASGWRRPGSSLTKQKLGPTAHRPLQAPSEESSLPKTGVRVLPASPCPGGGGDGVLRPGDGHPSSFPHQSWLADDKAPSPASTWDSHSPGGRGLLSTAPLPSGQRRPTCFVQCICFSNPA